MFGKGLSLLVVLSFLMPLSAGAEDDSGTEAPLATRLIPVGFLTAGRTDQIRSYPPSVLPTEGDDEERPLFGCPAEEPLLPLGTIDELIEVVLSAVEPRYWEMTEGAHMRALGEHLLVVRAEPRVSEAVSAYLGELERRYGQVVSVDVRALRVETPELLALRDAGFATEALGRLVADGRPTLSQSLTVLTAVQAAGFGGTQRAWLASYDAEVAEGSQIGDPYVGVANLGLALEVRAHPIAERPEIMLRLEGSLSGLADSRTVNSGETGTLEAAAHHVVHVNAHLVVREGEWNLIGGTGGGEGDAGWRVLVRARRIEAPPASGAPLPAFDLPSLPGGPVDGWEPEDLVLGYHPVRALSVSVRNLPGEATHLMPSAFAGIPGVEVLEPMMIVAPESLVDLIHEVSPESAWEDPAYVELRYGILMIRNTPAMHVALGEWLGRLRAHRLRTTFVTAELLEMDAGLADRIGRGGPLDEDGLVLLGERIEAGATRRVSVAQVTSLNGARNTARAGRQVSYVYDYDANIAKQSAIQAPQVARYLDGVELDVQPHLTADGRIAQLSIRYLRSQPGETRRAAPGPGGGTLELPELGMQRIRTEVAIGLNRPTVVASWGEGDRVRLLLVRAELR